MREGAKAPYDKCPHCGKDWGYYTKEQVSGPVRYQYNFDGTEADNSEMYELTTYTGGAYAYCSYCDKRLFRMDA